MDKNIRTLTHIVLAAGMTLSGIACTAKPEETKTIETQVVVQDEYPIGHISGEIVSIDEDSIPYGGYSGAGSYGGNLEIEHFRIRDDQGNIFKMIHAGPLKRTLLGWSCI